MMNAGTFPNGSGTRSRQPATRGRAMRLDQFPDGGDHQFGLIELNPWAPRGNDVTTSVRGSGQYSGARRSCSGGWLPLEMTTVGISPRHDESRHHARIPERQEMISHRMKALRLRPDRLHQGVRRWWKLSHFSDEPIERAGNGGAKQPGDALGIAGRPADQKRQADANDADASQPRAYAVTAISALSQPVDMLWCRREPFQAGSTRTRPATASREPHREPADDEAAERVPDQDGALARCTSARTAESSSTMRSNVRGQDGTSLQPRPARS